MTLVQQLDDPPLSTPYLSELASSLLGHLESEALALSETTRTLETLQQGLRGASLEKLRTSQVEQESLSVRLEQLRQVRVDLIRAIGAALHTAPEAVTVRALAARLPGALGQQLDEVRQRTHRLARQVESLNQQNAVLAMHCLTFVQGCLSDLYGEATAAARYSSAGRTVEAPRGSLVEVRG
jgi:hypothetical protein